MLSNPADAAKVGREIRRPGDADLRVGLGHASLGRGNIRTALEKLRRNAKRNRERIGFQRFGRNGERGAGWPTSRAMACSYCARRMPNRCPALPSSPVAFRLARRIRRNQCRCHRERASSRAILDTPRPSNPATASAHPGCEARNNPRPLRPGPSTRIFKVGRAHLRGCNIRAHRDSARGPTDPAPRLRRTAASIYRSGGFRSTCSRIPVRCCRSVRDARSRRHRRKILRPRFPHHRPRREKLAVAAAIFWLETFTCSSSVFNSGSLNISHQLL